MAKIKKRRPCRCKVVKYSAYITTRSGRRLYARTLGFKAWRLCACRNR
jgi:hypothetical protein